MLLFPPNERRLSWSTWEGWRERLWKQLLLDKLNTRLGYALGLAMALLTAWLVGRHDASLGWNLLLVIFLVPMLVASFLRPRLGLFVLLGIGFVLMGAKRWANDAPLGLIVDVWILVMASGSFFQLTQHRNWTFLRHPLVAAAAVWILFCALEYLNPWSRAELGWLYAFRSLAGWMLLFPIALYAIQRPRHIMQLHRWWVALVLLSAALGLYQWFVGPFSWELDWLMADQGRFEQWSLNGKMKPFAFFADPTVLGTVSSITLVVVLILGLRPGASLRRKLGTAGMSVLLLAAILVSGSKLALMLPFVGWVFFAILSWRKPVLISAVVLLLLGAALLWLPIRHPAWEQASRALNPWNSTGYLLREQNQSWVQPFIWEHPIGVGLGKTGELGKRFAPDVWLSEFPPDSAYMRIAVETGWIGLFLFLGLYFAIFRTGIQGLFRASTTRMKAWYHAYLTFAFLVLIGNTAQQLHTQLPIGLMLMIVMAMLVNGAKMESTSLQEEAPV